MVEKERGIPSQIIVVLVNEWVKEYGPTYPLYGKETVRHDISGSVRPLLASTEIPHLKVLAEMVGVSKKTIARIMNGETKFVTWDLTDKLLSAMQKPDAWWNELLEYY